MEKSPLFANLFSPECDKFIKIRWENRLKQDDKIKQLDFPVDHMDHYNACTPPKHVSNTTRLLHFPGNVLSVFMQKQAMVMLVQIPTNRVFPLRYFRGQLSLFISIGVHSTAEHICA